MWPSLPEGTIVETRTPDTGVRVGDVVVARHPFRAEMLLVKRVYAIESDTLILHGDAAHGSEDSRALGPFAPASIVGVVTNHDDA